MEKIILGLIEKVKINGKEIIAKIDTGADRNSIDTKLAAELNLGPITQTTKITSSHGDSIRPVVQAELEIKNKKIQTQFNLTNRTHMKCPVLIGKEVLKKGFIIDPSK